MSILSKKFIDPTPPYFGMDISDLSVKVLQMGHHRKFDYVQGFASEKIAPSFVNGGDIDNVVELKKDEFPTFSAGGFAVTALA